MGYRVRLSRMLVVEPPNDSGLALSGNELGSGQLDLDSLNIDGGVFLGVGEKGGFEVTIANCEIRAESVSGGFRGATVTISGRGARVELSRTEIRGAAGRLAPMRLPLAALAVDGGAAVRIAQALVRKGSVKAIHRRGDLDARLIAERRPAATRPSPSCSVSNLLDRAATPRMTAGAP